MNTPSLAHTVNWLFLDLNSFFASCEQQDRPELRGRPVAVVQMNAETTFAIAASYEAKAFGVKTGTMIRDAKKMCPGLVLVKARHKLYMDYHHRIIDAVDTCVPIAKVCSVDEMACRLTGRDRDVSAAQALAQEIKQAIRRHVGDCMTCSIGLAPSLFLGKVASDMQKPDGLVTITKTDLPHALHRLDLSDIYGIGCRIEARLNMAGIATTEELMKAPRGVLRRVWGGVTGVLYHELLRGADLQFPSSPETHSISHQHVLEPELRTPQGARRFSRYLLGKAAERLRDKKYYARRLGLFISWLGDRGRLWDETGFHETQDTAFLLARLEDIWRGAPEYKPIKVGVVLFGLVPAARHQFDLFESGAESAKTKARRENLSLAVDSINRRYGRGAIAFGCDGPQIKKFTGHAAFQRIPDAWEF